MPKDPIGLALSIMNRISGNPLLDRLGLRSPLEKTAYHGTRAGFRTIALAGREFNRVRNWLPQTRLPARKQGELFDLSLDDDQLMITDSLHRLSREVLRPNACEADESGTFPARIMASTAELGLTMYAVPGEFGGVAEQQSPVTSVLIAEKLAWGDMGLALALLAPFSVAQAISQWGTGEQQSHYLPAFCEDHPPMASIALDEPTPLFDPMHPATTAIATAHGYRLNGEKAQVVMGGQCDLLLVAAVLDGKPRMFIVETAGRNLLITDDDGMGLRATGAVKIFFDNTELPADALLGGDDFDYQAFIDRAALMRCGLAVGTAQAVLDYVIPYCNDRHAFGEPISHRQSVAFMISNLAIEIDSMRLLTWRAASRAEAGLAFHREASLARLLCNEKSMEVGSNGVQLLGGHGFVKEHPVERWYRDLRSVATHHGGVHA